MTFLQYVNLIIMFVLDFGSIVIFVVLCFVFVAVVFVFVDIVVVVIAIFSKGACQKYLEGFLNYSL